MQHNERAGLLWVLAGFCTLSIGDAIIKSMAGMWPPTAMGFTRYILAAIGLSAILVAREGWGALRLKRPGMQWLRGVAVSFSAVGMFMAVWIMPLAEATTLSFTQPIITAVLAVVFLHERARPATWIATLVAFAGVIIVLRPDFSVLGLGVFLPLIGAAGMAVMIIANRAVAGVASPLAMQFYIALTASVTLLAATIAGHLSGIPAFQMHWPDWTVWARCAFIAVSATIAHWFIYMGTTKAGAGTVAPMAYGQLLMAGTLGWVFFHNRPDATTLLGAAVIIGAGLYLWWQGRVKEAPERE